jgi:hypothetical protein
VDSQGRERKEEGKVAILIEKEKGKKGIRKRGGGLDQYPNRERASTC